jgi:uncharacterized membrane protein YfcA
VDVYSSSGDLGVFALGLVLTGVVSGLVSGVLGFGSGIVIVPVLYSVLVTLGVDHSARMHIAVATSLAALVPASLPGVVLLRSADMPDRAFFSRWALPAAIGALIGSALAAYSDDRGLLIAFAAISLIVAIYFVFIRDRPQYSSQAPESRLPLIVPAAIGGVSAMTGIDGGTQGFPAQMLFGGPSDRAASAGHATTGLIACVGAAGAIVMGWHKAGLPVWSLGYVNLVALGLILPGMLLAAPVGARFAQTADMKRMRLVFALFIAIAGARFLFDALA